MVLRSADHVLRMVWKTDIHIVQVRPLRVLCVCPSSKPCAERGQHCAEPTTTRTLAGQLRLGGTEMRQCCLPSDVGRQRTLEKERPVPEELHAHIQQALVSSVKPVRWRVQMGTQRGIHEYSSASTALVDMYSERSVYPRSCSEASRTRQNPGTTTNFWTKYVGKVLTKPTCRSIQLAV